jgi:hypothetical protein
MNRRNSADTGEHVPKREFLTRPSDRPHSGKFNGWVMITISEVTSLCLERYKAATVRLVDKGVFQWIKSLAGMWFRFKHKLSARRRAITG